MVWATDPKPIRFSQLQTVYKGKGTLATRDQATQQFMFIHHSRIKSAFPFKEDATMMPPNRRKEKERISYGLRISTEMIDEGKTEDPHEDVEKLEKEGDKTMNDQNARRLRMHVKSHEDWLEIFEVSVFDCVNPTMTALTRLKS
nr:hypothetical protein [Tanacetum cinerariifolium]